MARRGELERDRNGLPVVGTLERRLSLALVALATLWFTLAAAWEIAGPVLAGHYASSASLGIIADNMLHWRILGPVWEYTARRPPPSAYYCHHPWGIFWTTTLLAKLFGRHDVICRLAPVLLSAATPPLLFVLGRAIWRPAAGALAAGAFVVLPISLAFAAFNALEVPVITWSLVGLWGFVRHTQTGKRRHLASSLAGFLLALHADWPAYVLVGTLLAFGLGRGLLLRRRPFGPVAIRPYAQWWALTASAAVLTACFYVVVFHKVGGLGELLSSYAARSSGSDAPWLEVLAARRYWLELCFTPIAIALGALAAAVCLGRLVARRYEHDVVPFTVLAMAAVQYFVFKQGADIHVFWPHYFAAFFALGMGALTASVLDLAAVVRRKLGSAVARAWMDRWGIAVVIGLLLLPLLAILRDGAVALGYARATGGRFNEKGLYIDSDGAKTAMLRWLEPQLPARAVVGMHDSMKATWAQVWALGGRIVRPGLPPPRDGAGPDVYLASTHFMPDAQQAQLARDHHIQAIGPFWLVRAREAAAPIDAYAIAEREPDLLEWYLYAGTEPVRRIEPDPFATWELRVHFEQPADPPAVEPRGLEQQRIAYNAALAAGDEPRAAELLRAVESALTEPRALLADGTELVGRRFDDGVQPVLTLVLRAAGPADGDVELHVRSRVVAPAALSTTMADPTEREVAPPLALSPRRWRAGWLYAHRVVIRKRPGVERFELSMQSRGAAQRAASGARAGADGPVEVLRLE